MYDLPEMIQAQKAYIADRYADFHRHPELGGQESRTIETVIKELEACEIQCEYRPGAGVIGWINRGKQGKKVALRADMDALPLTEADTNLTTERQIRSETDGLMHACGHDGHMAMLLGSARVLAAQAEHLPGEILLLFEQGEENSYGVNGIARTIIEEAPDTIWGIHLYNALPSGKISVDPGPRMPASMLFEIEIRGQGGHGARPDLSHSPLDCFTDVYRNLTAMRLNALDPFHATTFSVGQVQMGSTWNVIPETLTFLGSFRVTNLDESNKVVARTLEILDHCCALHHCSYRIVRGLKPSGLFVHNHKGYAALAEQSISKMLGEGYLQSTPPWMASESMAVYLKYVPGVFAFVGIGNPDKGTGAPHHNQHFELDQDVLPLGVAATVAYALDALVTDVDTSDFVPNEHPPEVLDAKPWLAGPGG